MTSATDASGRREVGPRAAARGSRSPVLTAAIVVGVLALVAAWLGVRGNLADGPFESPPGDQDMPVVAPAGPTDLSPSLQTVCAEPSTWNATDLRPALGAAVLSSGQADVCVDVYRVPDEDPAKDYYRAVASAWWTTQSRTTQWPWQARGEPAGEMWVELTWDPESLDNYWQTEWAVLDECDTHDVGETRQLPDLVPFGSELRCLRDTGAIGQPLAEMRQVTWSLSSPQEQDATVMVLDISVAEGEVPEFSVGVRQVDIEG